MAVAFVGCGGAQTLPTPGPIAILEPGAEPRQVVRQQPQLHIPEAIDNSMKLRATGAYTDTTLDTTRSAIDFPTIVWHVTVQANQVDSDGSTRVGGAITNASILDDVVDPRMKPIAAQQAAKLRGVTMSWKLAPDGGSSSIETSLRELPPGLLESWAVVPMFPATPIGIGARWSDTGDISLGGIRWHQTRTFTLTGLDDADASLTIDLTAHADSQAIRTEPNASIRLTSGGLHVTANVNVPLHGVAWTGDSHGSSELDLLIVQGHLRTSTTQSIEAITTVQRAQQ